MSAKVPGAVRPLIGFAALLRGHGFMIAPEQTVSFLQAVELLGPRTIEHVRKAATHSQTAQTEKYSRGDTDQIASVLRARVEHRNKKRT